MTFVEWLKTKDVTLDAVEQELAKALDDNERKDRRNRFHVSREGKTRLHKLWWEFKEGG